MTNIYCLSGLGADERIFKNLAIDQANLIFLKWAPFSEDDDIPSYARKMAVLIPEVNPIILGLSFGGMVATEIALQMSVRQVFLISSAKGKQELGPMNWGLRFLISNNLIPYKLLKQPNQILFNRFGATTGEEKNILSEIVRDTDPRFLRWAFKAILRWQNTTIPPNLVQIHGTADKLIEPAQIHPHHWIDQGTHMMAYNRAKEINALIARHLHDINVA